MHNRLIVIVGPTAIGKTATSIALARHFGCEIISCDSRQFFSEMNIGTAVPSEEELQAAKHHLIQHKSITSPYTVGDYEKEAIEVLDQLFLKNDFAVMVGGSGLYASAVLNGIDAFPDVDENIKQEIRQRYADHGISWLQDCIKEKDPAYYHIVDLNNPQRLMRAVEVCLASGMPYSDFLGKAKHARSFSPVIIGLEADRKVIYSRINARVDQMIESGLIEEAERLLPFRNSNALQTVGYKELFDYFDGNLTLVQAIERIKQNTRRFAKRQMTWFRKMENVRWFDYTTDTAEIIEFIESHRS